MPTILVIESDEDFSKLLQMMLADCGAEVIFKTSGAAGLEYLRTQPVQLILLDLILPDMNGWEVYLQIRQKADQTPAPVIVLSEQGTRVDRTFGLRVAQVHDYLIKPFMPSQLRQSVAAALRSQTLEAHG